MELDKKELLILSGALHRLMTDYTLRILKHSRIHEDETADRLDRERREIFNVLVKVDADMNAQDIGEGKS